MMSFSSTLRGLGDGVSIGCVRRRRHELFGSLHVLISNVFVPQEILSVTGYSVYPQRHTETRKVEEEICILAACRTVSNLLGRGCGCVAACCGCAETGVSTVIDGRDYVLACWLVRYKGVFVCKPARSKPRMVRAHQFYSFLASRRPPPSPPPSLHPRALPHP